MSKKPKFYSMTRVIKPGFKWAIGFDENLAELFSWDDIRDPDEQMTICDLLCRLGLAEHRLFGEQETKGRVHQEHYYAATKKMRKLL
jgi:hypothetical protein